jgi:hypothetical protein
MREDSDSAVRTGAPPLMPASGPTVLRKLRVRPHLSRTVLIAAAVIIVVAAGSVVGLKAFTSPSPAASHNGSASSTLTDGTPASGAAHSSAATSKGKSNGKTGGKGAAPGGGTSTPGASGSPGHKSGSSGSHSGAPSSSFVSTDSGAGGSTSTTHYAAPDDVSSTNLAPVGDTDDIPYFEPGANVWDWLDDVHHCEIIGSDGTTEGIICLDLLEGNSNGTTWYTPALTAYCQTISTGDDVQCANITGNFGMYSVTGAQEAPEEYGWCGHSNSNPCDSGRNYFVDTNQSAWMTVTPAAASSCKNSGGEGTDCEIYPYAYSGVNIMLPGSDKHVILGASYTGADALGYY